MKYSILTHLFNNYETLKDPLYIDNDVEYICVSDDPSLKSNVWKIVIDDDLKNMSIFEKCYYVRFHPFKYVSTNICIKIDGSMQPVCSYDDLINKFEQSKAPLALKPHPDRNNIKDELYVWTQWRNYPIEKMQNQINYMINHGYDISRKNLIESSIIIYKNIPLINEINNTIFKTLKEIGGNEIERIDQTVISYLMDNTFKDVPVMLIEPLFCEGGKNMNRFSHSGNSSNHDRDNQPNIGYFRNEKYIEKPIFILGITNNELGFQIANEIKSNLPEFEFIDVVHSLDTFEEEPIRFAKKYSMEHHCPVGYIHTKGSVNINNTQKKVRQYWYNELHARNYFHFNGICEVNTPFGGIGKETFFNMFVADEEAWKNLNIGYDLFYTDHDKNPEIKRYYWEVMWRYCPNVKINGLIYNNLTENLHYKMFTLIDK